MKINIYVLYGGKSVEHEVSLQTALFLMNSLNKEKYNVYPVYITKEGTWCSLGILKAEVNDVASLQLTDSSTASFSIGSFLTKQLREKEKNIVFPVLHGSNGEDGTIQGF